MSRSRLLIFRVKGQGTIAEVAQSFSALWQKNIGTRTMNNVVAFYTAVADGVLECRQTEDGGTGADPAVEQR